MGDTGLGMLDPPRALVPVDNLDPSTTVATPSRDAASFPTAQPALSISSPAPARTSVVQTIANGDRIIHVLPTGATQSPHVSQSAKDSMESSDPDTSQPLAADPHQPLSTGASSHDRTSNPEAANTGGPKGIMEKSPTHISASGKQTSNDFDPTTYKAHQEGDLKPSATQAGRIRPSVNAGGYSIHAAPNGDIAVNSITMNSATPSGILDGVRVSLHSSGIVVGGNTLEAQSSAAPMKLNGHSVQIKSGPSGPQVAVDGKVDSSGMSQKDIGGNVVSVAADSKLHILATTLPYVPITISAPSPSELKDGNPATTSPPLRDGDNVASKIESNAAAGGAPQHNNDNSISGIALNVVAASNTHTRSATIALVSPAIAVGSEAKSPTTPPVGLGIFVGGKTFTALGSSAVAVDGKTLSMDGQSITLQHGEKATLNRGALVVGTQTIPLPDNAVASHEAKIPSLDDSRSTLARGSEVAGIAASKVGPHMTLVHNSFAPVAMNIASVSDSQTKSKAIGPAEITKHGTQNKASATDVKTMDNGNIIYQGVTLSKGGPAVTLPAGEMISLAGPSSSSKVVHTSSASVSTTTSSDQSLDTGIGAAITAAFKSGAERGTASYGWKAFVSGLLMILKMI